MTTGEAGDQNGDVSQVYTHGHHDAVLRSHRWRTASNSAAYLLPHLRTGRSLLDVGCGPGTLTADLATHVAPGEVLGIDTSAQVLEQARAHAAEVGRGGEVTFAVADILKAGSTLPSFDVVHAHQVLQHLADPVAALRAMRDRARPGGLVAVRDADYGSMTWSPLDQRLERWQATIREVTRRNGGNPDAGRHLLGWGRAAGLSDLTFTSSTWTFAAPEERVWWADLWAERITASDLAEHAQAYGLATVAELEEMAAGWREWAAQPSAVFIVVHGELLARVSGTADR